MVADAPVPAPYPAAVLIPLPGAIAPPTVPRRTRPTCLHCPAPAKIRRPKNHNPLCVEHFLSAFESEFLHTIVHPPLFSPAEPVAIGASGGKDSTVLAYLLSTLNRKHNLGLDLTLLSIDEGISGYRDASLATVVRNAEQYSLPLKVLSYKDLYGWTMDEVVSTIGKKSNCTYCGVFRRQALDRGAEMLGIRHVVTGHNADDMAETILMNLLRGDLPRLGRCAAITTQSVGEGGGKVKRSKPLKYAYQKEIVLYAHHRGLDYFTTECTYAPEAFRGSARDLVKALERVRPSVIVDLVKSGEAFRVMLGGGEGKMEEGKAGCGKDGCKSENGECRNGKKKKEVMMQGDLDEEDIGGCGGGASGSARMRGGGMHAHEKALREQLRCEEQEQEQQQEQGEKLAKKDLATEVTLPPRKPQKQNGTVAESETKTKARKTQTMRTCTKCGYLSSQLYCKACTLLEGLNKLRAGVGVEVEDGERDERIKKEGGLGSGGESRLFSGGSDGL
ncbi:hypothetical protein BDZ91DRAFT_722758 [Kalaharituber pfeilii]|nr:hypothetical protein BDZ91DRAFT_722758 [Kalaharituber pfeilii]